MVQSANTVDEFMSRFRTRLQGLAASHDLLISRDWTGVALADLVRRQIETFADISRETVEIAGPALHLTASATEAIGLALHELATNSAKYGALSVPNGRLKVAWLLEPKTGEPDHVVLEWSETEGPPVLPPKKKGFGSLVIERMVAKSVNGKVRSPTGLRWRLEFPRKHLVKLDQVDERNKSGTNPASADEAVPRSTLHTAQ